MAREQDRRVRRTTHRLKEALLELINERGYESIRVQDIARRADVGRSTFYSHYTSKDELLFDGFDRWLLSLADHRAPADAPRSGFRFSLPLLRHAQSQKRFLRASLFGGDDPRVRQKITRLLVDVVRRELDRMSPRKADVEAIASEAHAHGVAGAFLGLMGWWLAGGTGSRMGAEEVDGAFQRLCG